MKKSKIIFSLIILILMATIIACFFTTSNGNSEVVDDIRWYYEVVDGEAVKVRIISNGWQNKEKLIVPNTLGGYPVTEISGYVGYMNWSTNLVNAWYEIDNIEEVVLPEGLKVIGEHAFEGFTALERVNIPNSVESIEYYAFRKTKIKDLKIENIDLKVKRTAFLDSALESVEISGVETFTSIFDGCNINKVVIGEGVKTLNASFSCVSNADIQVSSDIEKLNRTAFGNATDAYIDRLEEEVELYNNSGKTWFHFKNLEKIETEVPEGIKVINADTNEEFTTTKATTGSNFSFKIEPEEGYTFDDYTVYLESYGTYYDDSKIIQKLDLNFGETYTIENVTRGKKIYVRAKKYGLDLALRQYIYSLNSEKITSREPVLEVKDDEQAKYLHTKSLVYPRVGDKIRYAIRVYNEGSVAGTANKIKYYIPEGLEFDETSETNTEYGWRKSEDGRTATTEYLRDHEIEGCTITNDFKNEEIYIDLILNIEPTDEIVRLVTMAEIAEGSGEDIDSTPGNIQLPISNDYKKEESEISNSTSYIIGDEDDYDYENVASTNNIAKPYSLIIKKIDGLDSQLLNGSTFELLDADKNVIKTGVTANGGVLDFGTVYAYGEDKTTYYIRETHTPEGYSNHLKYLIQVDVVSQINSSTEVTAKFELDIKDIDIDTSKYKTIAISSKADLMAIESNKEEKYVLTQDIDLTDEEWTPLNVENVKLDGQNHKITGLKLEGTDETLKTWGLFSTYSGIIENLTLEGVDINITKFNTEEDTNIVDGVGGFIGYSDGAILKNCKVSGAIGESLRNIGGLVGHTKAGSILVTRDCVNSATINFANASNVGGIVGCALGPVKSYNDKNEGNILGGAYNVGGIVGYARQEGYATTQVLANYEETTKIATLAIRNEAISGKYQFKIAKTNEDGKLLNGAKFQILDRNKQVIPGYEAIEATNGIINYEETKIDCMGNDVYYIKEIEAPKGYLALEDNYIKVVIAKKWDKENEKYYTETSYKVLSNEEYETEVSEEYNTSISKTGLINDNYTNQNVQWNINEVDIENATNDADLTGADNARTTIVGGILGNSKGRTLISGSINNKPIVSNCTTPRAAGIAGTIEKKFDTDEANIMNCTNGASISTSGQDSSYGLNGDNAGIIAYSRINIKIDKCDNNGTVAGPTVGAGVLGNGVGNIEIKNCNNNNVISSSKTSAGILGENFVYNETLISNGNTIIENCTNAGVISSSNRDSGARTNAGGIYGNGDPYELTISKCTVDNVVSISGNRCVSGIAAYICSEDVKISDCKVDTTNITNTNLNNESHVSGIIGAVDSTIVSLGSIETRPPNGYRRDVIVDNCTVTDSKIEGANATGIESFGGNGGRFTLSQDISNCNVIDTIITSKGNSTYAAGIYGGDYLGGVYDINACKVEGCTITASEAGYANVAGIFGGEYNSGAETSRTNITNCEIIETDLINNKSHQYSNTSGVLGDMNQGMNLTISNIRVYDCNLTAKAGDIGGIFNFATTRSESTTATLSNCTVEKTNITNQITSPSGYGNVGGMSGFVWGAELTFNNCNVIDCEIKANNFAKNMAGIIGMAQYVGKVTMNDCHVLETNLENKYPNTSDSNTMGGLVASTVMSIVDITECSVEDSSISGMARNIGGMFGAAQSGRINTFTDCLVDNTTITLTEYYSESSGKTMGGICAGGTEGFSLTNCTVSNSTLNSKQGATGGIVGSSVYNSTFTGCTVDNVKIINEGTYDSRPYNYNMQSTGGIIGATSNSSTTLVSLTNCNVINNCEIIANTQSTGGLVGSCYTLNDLSGCKVQDLKITSNAPWNSGDAGSIAGLVGDSNTVKNGILNNTVKNVEVTTKSDRTSGLLGEVYNSPNQLAITGNTVENLTLHHTGEIGNRVRHMAGFIGYLSPETNLSNNVLKNCTITADAGNLNAADIAGICSFVSNKINIDGTNTFSDINITNNTSRGQSGGLVALSGEVKIANLQNYNNISVKGNDNVGGIIAISNNSDTSIKGVQGSNITVNGYNYTGGLIGIYASTGTNFVMENIELNTVKANGKGCVGGLIGHAPSSSLKNIELTNVTAENTATSKITAYNAYGSSVGYTYNHTGGIIGNAGDSTIENATINGLIITNNAQDGNTGGIIGNIAKPNNYYTGTPIGTFNEITINKLGDENNSITASSGYVGSLLGYGTLTTSDINISNTDITSTGASGTGTVGFLTTGSNLKDVTVNNCNISAGEGHVGGIVGMANDNVENCTITDSEVKLTGTTGATGGIVGHGSNVTGTDVSITNCKVITTAITGDNQVGGISGGAVNTIEGCYVGGKEGTTYTEDEPAVTIIGNDSVGGIIGDAGIISDDTQMMITLKDNTIKDTKIERNERAKLTGESDDEHKMIGIHNSFGITTVEGEEVQYTGDQEETITGNTVTNVILNEVTD